MSCDVLLCGSQKEKATILYSDSGFWNLFDSDEPLSAVNNNDYKANANNSIHSGKNAACKVRHKLTVVVLHQFGFPLNPFKGISIHDDLSTPFYKKSKSIGIGLDQHIGDPLAGGDGVDG